MTLELYFLGKSVSCLGVYSVNFAPCTEYNYVPIVIHLPPYESRCDTHMDMHAACVHFIFLWSHIGSLQGSDCQVHLRAILSHVALC